MDLTRESSGQVGALASQVRFVAGWAQAVTDSTVAFGAGEAQTARINMLSRRARRVRYMITYW